MRTLWKLVKLVLALALVVPLGIIVLAVGLGIFGTLVGLAFLTLKLAFIGLIAWVVFKFAVRVLGGRSPRARPPVVRELPPPDPHYEAAMRELDRELGHSER